MYSLLTNRIKSIKNWSGPLILVVTDLANLAKPLEEKKDYQSIKESIVNINTVFSQVNDLVIRFNIDEHLLSLGQDNKTHSGISVSHEDTIQSIAEKILKVISSMEEVSLQIQNLSNSLINIVNNMKSNPDDLGIHEKELNEVLPKLSDSVNYFISYLILDMELCINRFFLRERRAVTAKKKKFDIEEAIQNPGSLRRHFGLKDGENIPIMLARKELADLNKKNDLSKSEKKLKGRLNLFLNVLYPASKKNKKAGIDDQEITYSYQEILVNSDLTDRRLPVIHAQSKNDGPVLWLTACSHGDEVGGVAVIHEIFKRLQESHLICGSVHAFPLMNQSAFEVGEREIPIGEEDLNRKFLDEESGDGPSKPDGSLADRIAFQVFHSIKATSPSLVLDLHNDWTYSIPHTLVDPAPKEGKEGKEAHKKSCDFASKLGLVVVSENDESVSGDGWESTLSGSLVAHGIPALTIELGESRVINDNNVSTGVSLVFNALAELGMIKNENENGNQFVHPTVHIFGEHALHYSDLPYSEESGIVRFRVQPGDPVKIGDVLADVYNVFGKVIETLHAVNDGIVLGHGDTSVAQPGLPILSFATKTEPKQPEEKDETVDLVEETVPSTETPDLSQKDRD